MKTSVNTFAKGLVAAKELGRPFSAVVTALNIKIPEKSEVEKLLQETRDLATLASIRGGLQALSERDKEFGLGRSHDISAMNEMTDQRTREVFLEAIAASGDDLGGQVSLLKSCNNPRQRQLGTERAVIQQIKGTVNEKRRGASSNVLREMLEKLPDHHGLEHLKESLKQQLHSTLWTDVENERNMGKLWQIHYAKDASPKVKRKAFEKILADNETAEELAKILTGRMTDPEYVALRKKYVSLSHDSDMFIIMLSALKGEACYADLPVVDEMVFKLVSCKTYADENALWHVDQVLGMVKEAVAKLQERNDPFFPFTRYETIQTIVGFFQRVLGTNPDPNVALQVFDVIQKYKGWHSYIAKVQSDAMRLVIALKYPVREVA